MELEFGCGFPTHDSHPLHHLKRSCKTLSTGIAWSMATLALWLLFSGTTAAAGNLHNIVIYAERLPGNLYGYRMAGHIVRQPDGTQIDITNRYVTSTATIPGPTIILDEGDIADIELLHQFDPHTPFQEHVSLHVHGVHYDRESDGTLKYINLYKDESAVPHLSYVYRWNAAPGTAGTWPYHDHNMENHNGAEDKGLFGALIVRSAAEARQAKTSSNRAHVSPNVAKDYVFYLGDDAFWAMEIDNATGKQTALGTNPPLTAQRNTNVRFHLIALGTNFHQFELPKYQWTDPGTRNTINRKVLGPLEKHVFTVKATHSSRYQDTAFASRLLGMRGDFIITR
ncbi:multicopper oxidase domain-containing protein [Nitrosomonas europaea]|uniref:multicopper oxidase domain-containing protein n=1 Tax=Nitrosomonas europaea TaxID=915 RepID=UPI00079C2223|nr:multicopper oxidase domain-containing protein [Nitrosomonas europaea]KXK49736.1 MAG: multicopper oxidase type 3 [Nitrosomonas europaea]